MINYHVLTINEINYKLYHKSIALLIVELPMKLYIYIYSEHLLKSVTYVKHNFSDKKILKKKCKRIWLVIPTSSPKITKNNYLQRNVNKLTTIYHLLS